MEESIYIFEYQPPRRMGDRCNTHLNCSYKDGRFRQPLFSNGYYPITALPESVINHPKFEKLLREIAKKNPPYKEAVEMTLGWIMENAPHWEAKF